MNPYEGYIRANPDLLEYYNTNIAPSGMSMATFGENHWRDSGSHEGRSFPGGAPGAAAGGSPSGSGTNNGQAVQSTGVPGLDGWLAQAPANKQGAIDENAYAAARPDLRANWDNNPGIQQTYGGDFSRYLTDDYFRSSNGPAAFPQFNKSTPATTLGTGAGSSNTATSGGAGGTGTGLTSLLDPNVRTNINNGLNANGGATGNTSQTSGSEQSGGYTTNNTTAQNQATQTTDHQVGASNQNSTGTQASTSTGTNTTNGTTTGTTNVIDTLGLGDLIKSQTAGTEASDAARREFLTNTMQTGGDQFNSQLEQGIRNSLTGAQMTGAGDSARGRAAGYGAAEVGRKNMDQRLAASGQLGGPTGSGTLAQQGAPLLGSSTTGTNNSVGSNLSSMTGSNTNNTTGSTTQDNFQNVLSAATGSNNTTGTATGSSLSSSFGNTPIAQQSSGGGCFVCSALATLGEVDPEDVREAVRYKLYTRRSQNMPVGYSLYGPFLARLVLRSTLVRRLLKPIALRILREELRLAGRVCGYSFTAWALHFVWHNTSGVLGLVARCFGAKFKTRNIQIAYMLKSNNLFFSNENFL